MNINIIHTNLLVAVLFLLTAYPNFININSLIRQKRNNEFLFRKNLGATRYYIIKQLFTKYSILYIMSSLAFLLFFSLSKYIFNQWINLNLNNYHIFNHYRQPVALLFTKFNNYGSQWVHPCLFKYEKSIPICSFKISKSRIIIHLLFS
jgi:hypothetical protein